MQLCIDLGGSSARAGLIDGSRVVDVRSDASVTEFDVQRLDELVEQLLPAIEAGSIDGVGIAVPGVVDAAGTSLLSAHGKYPRLIDVDLHAWAIARFGSTVVIENDARAALVGELALGPAAGERDAVLMVLGTGIGTAAIIDGVLLRGRYGHAGILGGHVTVELDAADCPCGNRGCAESLASTWALPRVSSEQLELPPSSLASAGSTPTIRSLVDADAGGDAVARRILDRFIDIWSAALVSLCHAYDPNVIVLTGGVVRAADRIVPSMTAYLDQHLWSSSHRPAIVVPTDPQSSVLRGLAALVAHPRERNEA